MPSSSQASVGAGSTKAPTASPAAEPGEYHYDDESTYAEYTFDVGEDGLLGFTIGYVRVDDGVMILDELEVALAGCRKQKG